MRGMEMEVENKPQPMAGFAVGILSPGKRTNQVLILQANLVLSLCFQLPGPVETSPPPLSSLFSCASSYFSFTIIRTHCLQLLQYVIIVREVLILALGAGCWPFGKIGNYATNPQTDKPILGVGIFDIILIPALR